MALTVPMKGAEAAISGSLSARVRDQKNAKNTSLNGQSTKGSTLGAAAAKVGGGMQSAVLWLQRVELMCLTLVLALVLLCVGNCGADVKQVWIQPPSTIVISASHAAVEPRQQETIT